MAISLGVVFVAVLIALIIVLSTRHDDPQAYPIVVPPYDNGDWAKREATSPTPFLSGEKKLETLAAATAVMAAGHPGTGAAAAAAASRDRHSTRSTGEAPTSSDDGSIYDDVDDEGDDSLPLRGVRYSFDAEREEELSISTNDMVEVLDDTDEHWHIVRRLRDGRQGRLYSKTVRWNILLSRTRRSCPECIPHLVSRSCNNLAVLHPKGLSSACMINAKVTSSAHD